MDKCGTSATGAPPAGAGQPVGPAPGWVPEPASDGTRRWEAHGPVRGHIGLLHGVISSSLSWARVAPLLAEDGWDVTAVDLPGHGLGPRPKSPPSPLAALVEGTRAALPQSLTVLVGHSLGAVVALAMAVQHRGTAAGLVLEDPPGRSGIDYDLFADGLEALGNAVASDRDGYWARARADNPTWDDVEVDQHVAALEACDTAEVARAIRAGTTWDLAGMVRSAGVPVLVVAANAVEGAWPILETSALVGADREALAAILPPERFVVLEGGHSLHRENPGSVAELISGFAGELGG